MVSWPVFGRCGAMAKCVQPIATAAVGREPGAPARTGLTQSGHRFGSSSTSSPTPMPKICSSVCREACRALSRLGNCELSNAGSNSGVVRLHANWCWVSSPKRRWMRNYVRQASPLSIPKGSVHDPQPGLPIDQKQGNAGVSAPALPGGAAKERKGPISGMLSDPWRRWTGRLSCESGTQYLSLFCLRRRWNGVGLRGCDEGETASNVEPVSDIETEETGYGKKKIHCDSDVSS